MPLDPNHLHADTPHTKTVHLASQGLRCLLMRYFVPLDPNHIHADTPHERTVHLPSQGWRYGCHSARTGDDRPRGGQTRYIAHPWSGFGGRLIVTDWLPRSCCHSERATDAACEGCCNRGEK